MLCQCNSCPAGAPSGPIKHSYVRWDFIQALDERCNTSIERLGHVLWSVETTSLHNVMKECERATSVVSSIHRESVSRPSVPVSHWLNDKGVGKQAVEAQMRNKSGRDGRWEQGLEEQQRRHAAGCRSAAGSRPNETLQVTEKKRRVSQDSAYAAK